MSNPFQLPDSAELLKRMWSGWSDSLNLPHMLTPTLDLEEIDRRIGDLKIVEHWLNVNVGMLRNTIQGLEVQRGTLATLQAFSSSFESAATGKPAAGKPSAETPNPQNLWWDLMQQQFQHLAKNAYTSTPAPAADAKEESAAKAEVKKSR